jgi:hypothetical protein
MSENEAAKIGKLLFPRSSMNNCQYYLGATEVYEAVLCLTIMGQSVCHGGFTDKMAENGDDSYS